MRYELNLESKIVQYDGAVQSIADKKAILTQLFSQGVYECTSISNDGCEWSIEYLNTVNNIQKNIVVYYGNIRNEERNDREKKIQLNSKDPRANPNPSIILGVYCYEANDVLENLVFAGWNIDPDTNYPGNPSIRGLNIDTLQKARFNGFYKNSFRNNYVCTFRPEFIFYYIENILSIHNSFEEVIVTSIGSTLQKERNTIFYGSPGTGKSREVNNSTNGSKRTRITFHPETDYHSFVGSYKPVMEGANIKYDFVPQAFTKAYCNAWLNPNEPYFLIIEELNRGNCAQIFGDIFQCLDRDSSGQSEYGIDCDKDLAKYLKDKFEKDASPEILENYKNIIESEDFDKIILPSNLYIYATMNTSDQSLFPMDSAFKRRWDMKFVPVDYEDANKLEIVVDKDTIYNWGNFISIINPRIKELTGSEDKQLGNRFINPSDGKITFEQFRSKVLFYLWSEIYKDEVGSLNSIFKYRILEEDPIEFQFGELFEENEGTISQVDLFKGFMHFNGIKTISNK